MTLSSSIGNGVNFISKFLSLKLSGGHDNAQPLVDFLVNLNLQGEVCAGKFLCYFLFSRQTCLRVSSDISSILFLQDLMINDTLNTTSKLQSALIIAEASLSTLSGDTPYQNFEMRLSSLMSFHSSDGWSFYNHKSPFLPN